MRTKKHFIVGAAALAVTAAAGAGYSIYRKHQNALPVRVGIFVGGRTVSVYRAIMFDRYKALGLNVDFLTKDLYGSNRAAGMDHDEYRVYSNDKAKDLLNTEQAAKVRGDDLVDWMLMGRADAATIGETSFIKYALAGKPLVAVACIGYDAKNYPGHAIIVRKGLKIRTPKDFKGKRFIVRRSSGGDLVFFREFIESIGLNPDRDVTLLDNNAPDDKFRAVFLRNKVDGAYAHLRPTLASMDLYDLYRPLNWVNAELSQAVLVFHKDFVRKHPDKVEKFLEGTMLQNLYELSLPIEKRCRKLDGAPRDINKDIIQVNMRGYNLPVMSETPYVRLDLLNEMQRLLVKHKIIKAAGNIEAYVDNSFVEKLRKKYNLPADGGRAAVCP